MSKYDTIFSFLKLLFFKHLKRRSLNGLIKHAFEIIYAKFSELKTIQLRFIMKCHPVANEHIQ